MLYKNILHFWLFTTFALLLTGVLLTITHVHTLSLTSALIVLIQSILFFYIGRKILDGFTFNITSLAFLYFLYACLNLLAYKLLYLWKINSLFEFSAVDSLQYAEYALEITTQEFPKSIITYFNNNPYDDFGAVFLTSLAYFIYPSPVITNFLNLIAGGVSTIYLYLLVKQFLPKKGATFVVFFYSFSSYNVYMISTGMKEVFFSMFVILFYYHFAKSMYKGNKKNIFFSILYLIILPFFRPAVMIFVIISVMLSIIYTSKNKYFVPVILATAVACIYLYLDDLTIFYYRYYGGVDALKARADYVDGLQPTTFNFIFAFASGLAGPFPTFIPSVGGLQQFFYAPGLLFKLMLVYFFWKGTILVFRLKDVILCSLAIFSILEMLSLSLVLQSFELRFNYPHLAFFYVIAVFYTSHSLNESFSLSSKGFFYILILPLLISFAWNLRGLINI